MLVTSSGYVCVFPPCSTSAFIVIVLILSSSFSYNIPLDDFLSSLLLGLTLQSFLLALSIRVVPPDIGIAEDVGHRKLSDFDVYNLIQKFLRFFFLHPINVSSSSSSSPPPPPRWRKYLFFLLLRKLSFAFDLFELFDLRNESSDFFTWPMNLSDVSSSDIDVILN